MTATKQIDGKQVAEHNTREKVSRLYDRGPRAEEAGCLDRRARYVPLASACPRELTALGKVYDVTDFLDEHPGVYNSASIYRVAHYRRCDDHRVSISPPACSALNSRRYGGMDATEEYEPIHPPDAITDNLGERASGEISAGTDRQIRLSTWARSCRTRYPSLLPSRPHLPLRLSPSRKRPLKRPVTLSQRSTSSPTWSRCSVCTTLRRSRGGR